ncbi:MAG: hypothetical protein MPJ25_00330 [Pirellulales bacterium]|nr:hypothetical protein [Pirellulales bacterium]
MVAPRPGQRLHGLAVHGPGQVGIVMVHDFTAFTAGLSPVWPPEIPAARMEKDDGHTVPAGPGPEFIGPVILFRYSPTAPAAVGHRAVKGPQQLAFPAVVGFHIVVGFRVRHLRVPPWTCPRDIRGTGSQDGPTSWSSACRCHSPPPCSGSGRHGP